MFLTLFNFGTATNAWFDGLRGISLRAGVRDVPPEGKKEVVQSGTQIVVREGVRFIRPSNTASMIVFSSVKSLCSAQPITEDSKEANEQSRPRCTRNNFHVEQNVRNTMTTDWSLDSGGSASNRTRLRKTIIPAVLDVRMNLTPSLITMSVPGDMLRYCHQETAHYTT